MTAQSIRANAPFDGSKRADVVLRSSNGVDFHVRSAILAEASPFFESMFTLPQAASEHATHAEDLPIIPCGDDDAALDTLLRICYPIPSPDIDKLVDLEQVLRAATKYDMEGATKHCTEQLVKNLHRSPLGIFAIACLYRLPEIARAAARASLEYEWDWFTKNVTPSGILDRTPESLITKLQEYRENCAHAALEDSYGLGDDPFYPECLLCNPAGKRMFLDMYTAAAIARSIITSQPSGRCRPSNLGGLLLAAFSLEGSFYYRRTMCHYCRDNAADAVRYYADEFVSAIENRIGQISLNLDL
ncbi:hypothetical protein WOLCODRAFT_127005 [Wolfiporia cocos MD-104 SS10]|uniref:BTB domain-containing protein n=1 Tax=Wolfiporia cocos (strain MD-104) TaxID=742152 RepID=A0A2H3J925_WOLCO|nr:hypothetical protein WOLCODRAFT_127005 [Wolfiporia cocos MD-104 SS10]